MEKKKLVGIKVFGIIWAVSSCVMVSSLPVVIFIFLYGLPFLEFSGVVSSTFILLGFLLNVPALFMAIGIIDVKRWALNILFVLIGINLLAIIPIFFRYRAIRPLLLIGVCFLLSNVYYFTRSRVRGQFK